MNFKTISVSNENGVQIICVEQKRIFLDITETFRTEINQVLQENVKSVLLDLTNVHVMNSAALGVLLTIRDHLLKQEGELVVIGLQTIMQDIFNRMKLDDFFNIYKTREDGLAHFAGK